MAKAKGVRKTRTKTLAATAGNYSVVAKGLYIPGRGNVIPLHRVVRSPREEYEHDSQPRKRAEKRTEFISVRVSDATKIQLEAIAGTKQRSLSWMVDKILQQYLGNIDSP